MTRLVWGEGPPGYTRGVSLGVLYLSELTVPWNGLVSVEEKATGSVDIEYYFDGNRMHISQDTGTFDAIITAFTYPDVFDKHIGQADLKDRARFGLAYRVETGDSHYLHLVYNLLVQNDSNGWGTVSDVANAAQFKWDVYGEPVSVPGSSPASHLILTIPRSEIVFTILENILYGTDTTEPRLPSPDEVIEIYESHTIMRVTYLGNGAYTVTGPDDMVSVNADGSFDISSPTANFVGVGEDVFVISSY